MATSSSARVELALGAVAEPPRERVEDRRDRVLADAHDEREPEALAVGVVQPRELGELVRAQPVEPRRGLLARRLRRQLARERRAAREVGVRAHERRAAAPRARRRAPRGRRPRARARPRTAPASKAASVTHGECSKMPSSMRDEGRPVEPVQLGEADALDRQRHDLEAVDVDQPEVGDLERRDHREREEAQRHERRDDADALLGEQPLERLEPLDDLRRRLVGEQAGDRQRQLAAHVAVVVHHDPAADLAERGRSRAPSRRRRRRRSTMLWASWATVVANAPRCRPKPRTKPTPTRPVAWWRSTTAILAMSRAGSAMATPCSTVGSSMRASVSSCSGTISITRTGRPVDGTRRSERPTGAACTVWRTQTGTSGLGNGDDGLAVEDELAVLVDAARRGTRRGRPAARGRRGSPARSRPRRPGRGTARGAARRAAARPRAGCPRRPRRGTSGRCGPRARGSRARGRRCRTRSARARTRARAAGAPSGCARSRPRGSGPRRPCGASRAPPRRSSTRGPSGCRRRGRRRGARPRTPGACPSACVAPRSVSLRSSSGSPAMTAGKFIISATPSAWRRRSTDSRSPIESGRRGDSKRLAGTHDDAITQTSSGTSSQHVEQPVDAVGAEHVRDLVRVGDDRGGAVGEHRAGELVDHQLRRLDVHVRVDEAGHEVAAARVDALSAGVAAEPRDAAVGDRDVDVEPLLREDREDARVLDHEVGLDVAARDVDQAAAADSLEHYSAPLSVSPTMSSGRTGTRTSGDARRGAHRGDDRRASTRSSAARRRPWRRRARAGRRARAPACARAACRGWWGSGSR